jgi:hypothetical protein
MKVKMIPIPIGIFGEKVSVNGLFGKAVTE